jgi:hypothetical protein
MRRAVRIVDSGASSVVIWAEPERYYASTSGAYWDQGDIVLAPVAVLDAETEVAASRSVGGVHISRRRMFWSEAEADSRTTGDASLGLAMIVSHGCSLEKEFNRRFEQLRRQGVSYESARTLAGSDETLDRLVTIAPLIPLVEAAPSQPAVLRANKVLGYFPVCESVDRGIDEALVDLSRCTTIDRDLILGRLGILSEEARATLLYALARYWAYRAPKLTYELEQAIGQLIIDVTVVEDGGLGVIFELGDGSFLHMLQAPVDPGTGPTRPDLSRASG